MFCFFVVAKDQIQLFIQKIRIKQRKKTHFHTLTFSIAIIISSGRKIRWSTPVICNNDRRYYIRHNKPIACIISINSKIISSISIEISTKWHVILIAPLTLIDQPRSCTWNPRPNCCHRRPNNKIGDTISIQIAIRHAYITRSTPEKILTKNKINLLRS